MLTTAIIVSREILEAALTVSIVTAASVGIAGRNRWIGYGLLAVSGSVLGGARSAWADLKVRSPIVVYRELEFEHNGAVTFDHRTGLGKDQSYTYSLGYGLTPFWKIELEAETGAPPSERLKYRATTLENTFQLTPQGKYWTDLGFFAEYSQGALRGATNTVKFGPIAQKETTGFGGYNLLHTLNVFFERELGPNSTSRTGFAPAFQSRIEFDPLLEPGIEIYGIVDNLGRVGKLRTQQYRAGPVLVGAYSFAPYGKVKYQLGYQLGITPSTPHGTIRWKFEYELAF